MVPGNGARQPFPPEQAHFLVPPSQQGEFEERSRPQPDLPERRCRWRGPRRALGSQCHRLGVAQLPDTVDHGDARPGPEPAAQPRRSSAPVVVTAIPSIRYRRDMRERNSSLGCFFAEPICHRLGIAMGARMNEDWPGRLQREGVAALALMEKALQLLDTCPHSGEADAHLDLAICRLKAAIAREASTRSDEPPPQ